MRKTAIPAILLAAAVGLSAQAAGRRALLIGINDYTASRLGVPRVPPPPDRDWNDLTGAVNDVRLMRQMLICLHGFEERDIVTLTDQEATREAILRAIDGHLVRTAARDDVVVFYFAGHGSLVRNSLSDESDRMDESLVPADSRLGVRDIRDKELRSIFNGIIDRGARLTVILDSCYSGSAARGLPTGARPRAIEPDLRDVADRSRTPPPESRGALILAAAQPFEQAWETRDSEGTFRGVFSWALLRAMRDSMPDESASDTFVRASARMRSETPFQQPAINGTAEAKLTSLFSGRTGRRAERPAVAVEEVLADGSVLLHGGWAHGLSIGTELQVASDRQIAARIRVEELLGVARSRARVEPGRQLPQAIRSGALLEVVGWAAPPGRPLRVWAPRMSGNAAAIASLARRLHAEAQRRQVRWISDPTDVTPTHLLRRGHDGWELLVAATSAVERLGSEPADAIAGVAKVPRGAALFVQLPAPAAIVEGMAIGRGAGREGIDPAADSAHADYILAGRYGSNGLLQYAWIRPAVTTADRRKTGLPLRTDWVTGDGRDGTLRDSVATLRDALLRLRRIHAWHALESPPRERSPYRLHLRRASNGQLAEDSLIGGERYDVVLRSTGTAAPRARPQHVYVFVIDSHGTSTLLYPEGGTAESRIPATLPAPRQIALGQESAFVVAPPYGVDTFFLLTTDETLRDPRVLEWDGVRTRDPQPQTALEQLLLLVQGSASRAPRVVTPTSWSLEKVVFESVPPPPQRKFAAQ